MDARRSRPELYDPDASARLVRAHRATGGDAATCVVFDVDDVGAAAVSLLAEDDGFPGA